MKKQSDRPCSAWSGKIWADITKRAWQLLLPSFKLRMVAPEIGNIMYGASKRAVILQPVTEYRDLLRLLISELGYLPVCFNKEEICYDNLKILSPHLMLTWADDVKIAYRQLCAVNLIDRDLPLLLLTADEKVKQLSTSKLHKVVLTSDLDGRRLDVASIKSALNELINRCDTSGGTIFKECSVIGLTAPIVSLRKKIVDLGNASDPVMIIGEAGTGRELAARAIYNAGMYQRGVFIRVDCAKLTPKMLLSHMGWLREFYLRYDYDRTKRGVTFFLNSIEKINLELQTEFFAIWESLPGMLKIEKDNIGRFFRIISSADNQIYRMVERGTFRKDLFFRLNVITISMPSLRQRGDDIDVLADYFAIKYANQYNKCFRLPSSVLKLALSMYDWPGNIRELEDMLRKMIFEDYDESLVIKYCHPDNVKSMEFFSEVGDIFSRTNFNKYYEMVKNNSLKQICDEVVGRLERKLITKALSKTRWNRKKAAELLSISYKALLNKIQQYRLDEV